MTNGLSAGELEDLEASTSGLLFDLISEIKQGCGVSQYAAREELLHCQSSWSSIAECSPTEQDGSEDANLIRRSSQTVIEAAMDGRFQLAEGVEGQVYSKDTLSTIMLAASSCCGHEQCRQRAFVDSALVISANPATSAESTHETSGAQVITREQGDAHIELEAR